MARREAEMAGAGPHPARIALLSILMIACWAIPADAQRDVDTLSAAREKYSSSAESWIALQKDLPEILRRRPTAEAGAKLEAAERARIEMTRARLDYLELLRSVYAAEAVKYKPPDSRGNQIKETVIEADQGLLTDVNRAAARLDEELKAAAADRRRMAAVQNQRTELQELRSLVLSRGRDLDRIGAEFAESSAGRAAVSRAYGEVAEWIGLAIEAAAKDDEIWASAYAKLRRPVERPAVERPAPVRRPDPPAAPVHVPGSAPGVPRGGSSALVPNIGGLWLLDRPQAGSALSGPGAAVGARVEVEQTGDEVKGVFECIFAAPPNEPNRPAVRFGFTGKITNPILRFEIIPPLKGTILIRPADAGTLEVSYRIEGAKKSGVAVGSVPEQKPIVLRKARR